MKKIWMAAFCALLTLTIASCSTDGTEVASFVVKGQKYSVTVGDLKKALLPAVLQEGVDLNDTRNLRNIIFERGVAYKMIMHEEIANGLTNDPKVAGILNSQRGANEYKLLNMGGYVAMTNEMMAKEFEIARVSAIYLSNDAGTNLSDAKKMKVNNLMESIKNSKNLEKDFPIFVNDYSEDGSSKARAGDLGYFIKKMDMNDLEKAVFEIKGKSYSEKPIVLPVGVLILYVTDPAVKQNLKDISVRLGDNYRRMSRGFINSYISDQEKQNITNYFEMKIANFTITVGGQSYEPGKIPDDAKIKKIFDKVYTWKEIKSVILVFVPDFTNALDITNAFQNFMVQNGNFDSFMFLVEKAKKINYQNTADYKSLWKDEIEALMMDMAVENFKKKLKDQIVPTIDEAQLKSYYTNMKANFQEEVKDASGKPVMENGQPKVKQQTYEQVSNQVKMEVEQNMMLSAYESWKEEAKKNNQFTISDSGFATLKTALETEVAAARKKQQSQPQGSQPNRGGPQQ